METADGVRTLRIQHCAALMWLELRKDDVPLNHPVHAIRRRFIRGRVDGGAR